MVQNPTHKALDDILSKTRFSDDMRTALRLVFVDGKSPAEASALTGVSQTKIYVRRKQLNELLTQANLRQVTFIYPIRLQNEIDRIRALIDGDPVPKKRVPATKIARPKGAAVPKKKAAPKKKVTKKVIK